MKKILIGNYHISLLVALFFSTLISGCQSGQPQSNATELPPAGESRDVIYQESCSQDLQSHSPINPAMLYQEMSTCTREGRFDRAVFFFGLAGSYTWFDAQRVNSQYARAMHSKLLSEAMAQLTIEQKNTLWEHIQTTMNHPERKQIVCKKVNQAGLPDYSADYMLLEKKAIASDPLVASQQWDLAVKNYLDCSR